MDPVYAWTGTPDTGASCRGSWCQTWDDVSVDDLLGQRGASVTRVVIVDDKVVVTASLRPRDPKSSEPRQQVVVVGSAG